MQQFLYDRVAIFFNGTPYLPDGQITNFSMNATYNSTQQKGYTPDGASAAQIVGSFEITFNWNEYVTDLNDYINWRTYLIANPGTTITVIPVSIATGSPTGVPSFTITGINVTNQGMGSPGSDQAIMRPCSFNAQRSSNL